MAKGTRLLTIALTALLAGLPLLAAAECYEADADSGELTFSGVAEGSPFNGRFREFSVSLCLDDQDLTTAEIRVTVATGSATIGNRQGDQALKDEELFYVDRFPEAIWTSGEIVAADDGYRAAGELTLRGVTAKQPVRLHLHPDEDPARLTGSAEILRLEYQVGTGEFEDTDFIDNEVTLEFDLGLK